MGDFNIQVNKLNTPGIEEFLDILDVMNMKQIVNQPTHNKGNILDLIILNADGDFSTNNAVNGNFISDHRIVTTYINRQKEPIISKWSEQCNYKTIDKEKLYWDLDHEFGKLNLDSESLQGNYLKFEEICKLILDKHAPI